MSAASPLVKICGITRRRDALAAARAGADFLGFVFVETSPRYVTPAAVREIAASVRALARPPRLVGVFRNQSPEHVKRIAERAGLDLVQLHGDETEQEVSEIDLPVIKTLHVGMKPPAAERYAEAAWLLFDTETRAGAGGTGIAFDWTMLSGLRRRPFFLAGGLSAANVRQAVESVHPDAIDVSSGVEERPGIKSAEKIGRLFEKVRG